MSDKNQMATIEFTQDELKFILACYYMAPDEYQLQFKEVKILLATAIEANHQKLLQEIAGGEPLVFDK